MLAGHMWCYKYVNFPFSPLVKSLYLKCQYAFVFTCDQLVHKENAFVYVVAAIASEYLDNNLVDYDEIGYRYSCC